MTEADIVQTLQVALGHHRAGRLPEAEALYRQVLQQAPGNVAALHYLGVIALQVGALASALELIGNAAAAAPNSAEIQANLGEALRRDGQLEAAAQALERSLALDPGNAQACSNLGIIRQRTKHRAEAEACFRRALALAPDYAEAHNNLGGLLAETGRRDAALPHFQQAAALRPDLPAVQSNLGNALRDLGRLDEGLAHLARAVQLDPSSAAIGSCYLYSSLFHPAFDAARLFAEHRAWDRVHAAPLRRAGGAPWPHDRNPERRLRVGYVSPDFREHVVGHNMLPVFRHHDRAAFEVFAYVDVEKPDATTDRFRTLAHVARTVRGWSDEAIAAAVREDRIDILVDLTLHMADNRLLVFAREPAPVQVTFAGYPGTTGMDAIQYRLTDGQLDPPDLFDRFYAEKSVRLPDAFWCFEPPSDSPAVNALPAASHEYVTFGCLNNMLKISRPTIALWARILRGVESSRLLLLVPEGSPRQLFASLFQAEGIDLARIEFAPPRARADYLALYHRIDLSLDTLPYNGHTTSLDSTWMGVPVVTLVGSTVVGRAGLSQLHQLGLTELAADSADGFVHLACALARDRARLSALRATLRERMRRSPLMDAPRFTRGLEAAYRTFWRQWCAAPAPQNR